MIRVTSTLDGRVGESESLTILYSSTVDENAIEMSCNRSFTIVGDPATISFNNCYVRLQKLLI